MGRIPRSSTTLAKRAMWSVGGESQLSFKGEESVLRLHPEKREKRPTVQWLHGRLEKTSPRTQQRPIVRDKAIHALATCFLRRLCERTIGKRLRAIPEDRFWMGPCKKKIFKGGPLKTGPHS